MKASETHSVAKIVVPALDKLEQRIIKRAAIPPVFAQFLKEKSLSLGVAFALRVSQSPHRYLMPASPKPISVKTKTGNWSFTKGVISVAAEFGTLEAEKGEWKLLPRHENDLPHDAKFLKSILHRLSLQEVLSGLNIGEYNLAGTEEDIKKTGRIKVKAAKHPAGIETVFSINLTEKCPRVEPQCQIDFNKILAQLPEKESRPDWWNDQWGNFDVCLNNYYPAQYQHANDDYFTDILAYGVEDENGNVLPITGDQDLLWISMPLKSSNGLMREFSEVINTLEPGGVEKLYKARIALHLKMGGTEENAESSISNSSIAGLGCVTAYESYVINEVNKAFSDCGIHHLRNLIQHAAENHNPNTPSPLDAKMVHIWQGKISATQNEQELIKFFLQPGFPNENMIDIHPKWDMSKWSSAIYAQLVLKQPISPETLTAYKVYRMKSTKNSFFSKQLPDITKTVKDKGSLS
jgi:hypothetical protein